MRFSASESVVSALSDIQGGLVMRDDRTNWRGVEHTSRQKRTRLLIDLHLGEGGKWLEEEHVENGLGGSSSALNDQWSASATDMQVIRNLIAGGDRATVAHSLRVAHLAEMVAQCLGLPPQLRYLTSLAALLHDIGKVDIPPEILDKCGPLTEHEWNIMRLHPQIGYFKLKKEGGLFHHLAPIVLAHRERWDGKGYPRGMMHEQIPIEARILTVVDAFDAMTSPRGYRQVASLQEACRELQQGENSQFDGRVVHAFLDVLLQKSGLVGLWP
jgi:putative nucleotidyltransferase with HDIG domain